MSKNYYVLLIYIPEVICDHSISMVEIHYNIVLLHTLPKSMFSAILLAT